MSSEFVHWLEDLGRYVAEWNTRTRRVHKAQGPDYTSDEYREVVRRTVHRLHPPAMQLKVVEIIEETPSAKTFRFERMDGSFPPFRAGQYVNLFADIDGVHTSRAYSISSAPGENTLDLTVRRKPEGFVSGYLLDRLEVGDTLLSSGPAGQFYHEPLIDRGDLVFLAGGSGVTPFMSLLRGFDAKNWPVNVHMLYGSRTLEDTIFAGELDALSKDNSRFNYALVLSEPEEEYQGVTGFLTSELIRKHIGSLEGCTFMLCGPNAMYDFVLGELQKLEVPAHKIRREAYGPPDDPTALPGWPEAIEKTAEFSVSVENGPTFQATASEPLLNALERHGVKVPALCRSGECSYCRVKLLEGQVYMPPDAGVRQADREKGFIHSCVSYPLSDLKIRL